MRVDDASFRNGLLWLQRLKQPITSLTLHVFPNKLQHLDPTAREEAIRNYSRKMIINRIPFIQISSPCS